MTTQQYPIQIAIVGPSGSGKSTSWRNLDPATTTVIDIERKGFPFKLDPRTQLAVCDNLGAVGAALVKFAADPTVRVIVIESFAKWQELSLINSTLLGKGNGFDTYKFHQQATGAFLERIKIPGKIVVMTALDEVVKIPTVDGGEKASRSIATLGRAWEGKVEKEFLVVLFTRLQKAANGAAYMDYFFETNSDGVTTAKTPMDLFKRGELIPNDLAKVIQTIEERLV